MALIVASIVLAWKYLLQSAKRNIQAVPTLRATRVDPAITLRME
jgi:hypothetical protein